MLLISLMHALDVAFKAGCIGYDMTLNVFSTSLGPQLTGSQPMVKHPADSEVATQPSVTEVNHM
jgi:hypothetical protein